MKDMKKRLVLVGLTMVLCVGMAVLFAGCEKEGDNASPKTAVDSPEGAACGPDCTKPCCADGDAEAEPCPEDCTKPCCADKEKALEVIDTTTSTVEQTTCPVMGGPINKEIFTEYKGKKVYFCCSGCDTKFNADPEKYLAKLPQFAK